MLFVFMFDENRKFKTYANYGVDVKKRVYMFLSVRTKTFPGWRGLNLRVDFFAVACILHSS